MEAEKNNELYRFPCFAKLSKSIIIFGAIFLFSSIFIPFYSNNFEFNQAVRNSGHAQFLFAIFQRMITTMPVIITALSFVITALALNGLEISKKEYFKSRQNMTNLNLFLFFLPLVVTSFDKHIASGNTMYIITTALLYVFAMMYTILLLWRIKDDED